MLADGSRMVSSCARSVRDVCTLDSGHSSHWIMGTRFRQESLRSHLAVLNAAARYVAWTSPSLPCSPVSTDCVHPSGIRSISRRTSLADINTQQTKSAVSVFISTTSSENPSHNCRRPNFQRCRI